MTQQTAQNEIRYRITHRILASLLKKGLITDHEFQVMHSYSRKKYNPKTIAVT